MIEVNVTGTWDKLLSNINEKVAKELAKATDKVQGVVNEKAARIRAFRSEASRLTSLANKRLDRLEKNGLETTSAYQALKEKRFSVRGKSYQEVQAEVGRLIRFIDSNTSTVRGTNDYLKEMAKNTKIQYKNLAELQEKAAVFFELAAKVKEYNNTVSNMGAAIGYKQIWEQIDQYVTENNIELNATDRTVEEMLADVNKAIEEYVKPEYIDFSNDVPNMQSGFFTLPKD